MNLSERKKKILSAVIDENVATAEPVSSGQLQKEYLTELSSATIRNELATLEEMGLLYQPHTSAGRVPLAEAYKLYCEKAFINREFSESDLSEMTGRFSKQVSDIEKLSAEAAKIITDSTNYTSIVVTNNFEDVEIEEIKTWSLDGKIVE